MDLSRPPQRKKIFFIDNSKTWVTRGLFLEKSEPPREYACFTFRHDDFIFEGDGHIYESLYRLYMKYSEDPTEYEFATKELGGWEHWENLCECKWFQPYIEKWRREAEVKLRAKGIKEILLEAENGGKSSYDANKYLANAGWKPKELPIGGKRGRPSKADIQKELQEQAALEHKIQDDIKRLEIN